MTDAEIATLKAAVASGEVVWSPESREAHPVRSIGEHAEEGAGFACAILDGGKYVALYNADLTDFCRLTPIT
jgi:hypothetical protein